MGLAAGGNAAGQVTGPEEQCGRCRGPSQMPEDQARVAASPHARAERERETRWTPEVGYLDPAKAPPVPGAALQP